MIKMIKRWLLGFALRRLFPKVTGDEVLDVKAKLQKRNGYIYFDLKVETLDDRVLVDEQFKLFKLP